MGKKFFEHLIGLWFAIGGLAMALIYALCVFILSSLLHYTKYKETVFNHWTNHLEWSLIAGFLVYMTLWQVKRKREDEKTKHEAQMASWTIGLIDDALSKEALVSMKDVARKFAEKLLVSRARDVNWWKMLIITLQRGGLDALNKKGYPVPAYDEDDEAEALRVRDKVMVELEREFKGAQTRFYTKYDFYRSVREFDLELRGRAWSDYLSETPTEKAS